MVDADDDTPHHAQDASCPACGHKNCARLPKSRAVPSRLTTQSARAVMRMCSHGEWLASLWDLAGREALVGASRLNAATRHVRPLTLLPQHGACMHTATAAMPLLLEHACLATAAGQWGLLALLCTPTHDPSAPPPPPHAGQLPAPMTSAISARTSPNCSRTRAATAQRCAWRRRYASCARATAGQAASPSSSRTRLHARRLLWSSARRTR